MIDIKSALQNCDLFLQLEESVVAELLAGSAYKSYHRGEVIIQRGSVSNMLHVVVKGTIGVYNEDVLLAELKEWSVVGESFINENSASATIIVLSDLLSLEISKDFFLNFSFKYPRLILNVLAIISKRLRSSNDKVLKEAQTRELILTQLVEERTAELSATLEELRHTQKFRDQFLANMSHEIRTPMNAIVGLTNLLVKTPLNEVQQKYLDVIRKSGNNLLVLINDILDLSKMEAGKMELENVPFSLHGTILNVHTILFIKAEEKGIMLIQEIGEGVPDYIVGDETRLTQILINLTGNAIKFTENGKVTISVALQKKRGDTVELLFSVKDTGIGIPPEKLNKVFETFGQATAETARKYGGTGLGLSISKQLVEMHNGLLQVSSVFGQGSDFHFSISYVLATPPEQPAESGAAGSGDMSGRRILLVEDSPFNQMVAVDTLLHIFNGIVVDVAENGESAVAMAFEKNYDIILMDIQLPDFDGFEATRRIRAGNSEYANTVPICALTAGVSKEMIDQCLSAGMNDYLIKPFSQEMLRDKVIQNVLS